MHDVPDTEDADQSAERYWSDGFKDFIRTRIAETFRCRLRSEKAFLSIYEMYVITMVINSIFVYFCLMFF